LLILASFLLGFGFSFLVLSLVLKEKEKQLEVYKQAFEHGYTVKNGFSVLDTTENEVILLNDKKIAEMEEEEVELEYMERY